jgi:hypothetical protein
MKTHYAIQRANRFGGFTVTTLCRRMNKASTDGINSTTDAAAVTCGFCKPLLKRRPIFDFESFDDWVNNASRRFRAHGLTSDSSHCIDAKGRLCVIGRDFQRARDDSSFPVEVFAGSHSPTGEKHG